MEIGTGFFLAAIILGTVWLYVATRDRWNWKKLLLWPLAAVLVLSAIGGAGIYVKDWFEDRPRQELALWGIRLGASPADVKFAKGIPLAQKAADFTVEREVPDGKRFVVTAPDGKRFEITSPKGATDKQVLAYAESHLGKIPHGAVVEMPDKLPFVDPFDQGMVPAPKLAKAHSEPTAGVWLYQLVESDPNAGRFVVGFKDGKVRFVMYHGSDYRAPSIRGISPLRTPQDAFEKFGQPSFMSRSKDELSRFISFEKFNVSFELKKNKIVALGVYDPSTGPLRFADEAE